MQESGIGTLIAKAESALLASDRGKHLIAQGIIQQLLPDFEKLFGENHLETINLIKDCAKVFIRGIEIKVLQQHVI